MIQATIASGIALSRAVVRDTVSTDRAASQIGYVTMGMALMPMIGPMIGGFLVEGFGWRSIFAFMFVAGLGVTTLAWADLGETNTARSTSSGAQFRAYPEAFPLAAVLGLFRDRRDGLGGVFRVSGRRALGREPGSGPDAVTARVLFRVHRARLHDGKLPVRPVQRAVRDRPDDAGGCDRVDERNDLGPRVSCLRYRHRADVFRHDPVRWPWQRAGDAERDGRALVSVRPHLAGSASGLGGALQIGGGAALSVLAGTLASASAGAAPLVWLMFACSAMGIVTTLWVMRVAARHDV